MSSSGQSEALDSSAEITKKSKSNLAYAFACLPPEKRADMSAYYAFCRVVDDIADSPDIPDDVKREKLEYWRNTVTGNVSQPEPLGQEMLDLQKKYGISQQLFHDLIDGVSMDIETVRYETFEDLRQYCYRVASAVGLVMIEIVGYENPKCQEYVINLGYFLQMANIIRDVGEDVTNEGRIYLPLDEIREAGYSEEELLARTYNPAFLKLMRKQYDRAVAFYKETDATLPPEDRSNVLTTEIMRRIYWKILKKIEADDFRVYEKRYRIHKIRMFAVLAQAVIFRRV